MRLWAAAAIVWAVAVVSVVLAYMPMPFAIVVNRQHKRDRLPVAHIEIIKPKLVARVVQIEPPEFALPGRYVPVGQTGQTGHVHRVHHHRH